MTPPVIFTVLVTSWRCVRSSRGRYLRAGGPRHNTPPPRTNYNLPKPQLFKVPQLSINRRDYYVPPPETIQLIGAESNLGHGREPRPFNPRPSPPVVTSGIRNTVAKRRSKQPSLSSRWCQTKRSLNGST